MPDRTLLTHCGVVSHPRADIARARVTGFHGRPLGSVDRSRTRFTASLNPSKPAITETVISAPHMNGFLY